MELSKLLKIDDYDQNEVLIVLQSFFPHVTKTGPLEISMFITTTDSQNDNYAIKCTYTKKRRKLATIETGPTFPLEYVEQIKHKLESDLRPIDLIVRNEIFFSNVPVKNSYLFKDLFNIIPPPRNAPVPESVYGLHPFILQFKITESPDQRIKSSRSSIKSREIFLLLSVFLNAKISRISRIFKQHWVAIPQENSIQPKTLFAQEYYSIDGFKSEQKSFETIFTSQMEKIELNKYYSSLGYLGPSLSLPENIDIIFEKFQSLDDKLKQKFLRAAFWYHQSTENQNTKSVAFLNLINAIETLAADRKNLSTCPTCNKQEGAVQQFKTFIEQFAPMGIEEMKELYDTRSDLTHGRRLFEYDNDGIMSFTPFKLNEMITYEKANYITKVSLINWLLSC